MGWRQTYEGLIREAGPELVRCVAASHAPLVHQLVASPETRRRTAALTLAFWPMLSRLRREIAGGDDAGQLVVTCFLEAVGSSKASDRYLVSRLGWLTRRLVFRALRLERQARLFVLDTDVPAEQIAMPIVELDDALAGMAPDDAALVASFTSTSLPAWIAATYPNVPERERRRLYTTLRRRRSRAVARIRKSLLDLAA